MKATVRNRAPEDDSLYETDFSAWTQRTAELLRAGHLGAIDVGHVAEEIEDVGRCEVKELNSRVCVLLLHLLKWQFQPRRRSRSWAVTVAEQRDAIADDLAQSPSLRRWLSDHLPESYRRAMRRAAIETGLRPQVFPVRRPESSPLSTPWPIQWVADGTLQSRACRANGGNIL